MRKSLIALASGMGIFILGGASVFGCGDKFVVLGRGVQFQRVTASAHPASILLYLNPGSRVSTADRDLKLQNTLKLAGHKPAAVESHGELEKALSTGKYDLVLTDVSEAQALRRETRASASNTAVIPVVYNPSDTELADVEAQYSCVLKASKKNHDLLAVIDEAMQSKSKGSEVKCPKGK